MNILYFLEPRKELNNPLFRLGTVRNHLAAEITNLKKVARVNVKLLTSAQVRDAALAEGLLDSSDFITIDQNVLERQFDRNSEMGGVWYREEQTEQELKKAKRIYKRIIKGFIPDVIVCYESSAKYLSELYPEALYLNSMLGMLSRAPYPEMGSYDPVGNYGKSFLSRNKDSLKKLTLTGKQQKRLDEFRNHYSSFISERNPIEAKTVRAGFDTCLLLPLQVSGYFAFDDCLPRDWSVATQIDLVDRVMSIIDPNVGVYVTLHGAESDIETREAIEKLQAMHPNLLFDNDVQRVRWCSQWVLPYMDGVITVSSSVGYQSALWNKPVYVLGSSQLDVFNVGDISEVSSSIGLPQVNYDPIVYYILTRYSPLIGAYCNNERWLLNLFEKMMLNKGSFDLDFYPLIDDEDRYFECLLNEIRKGKTLEELERYSSHLESTRIVDVNRIKSKIIESDVISFDVFDTLITRRLMHPNNVFDLMGSEASEVFLSEGLSLEDFGGFRNLRERAANRLIRAAKKKGEVEIRFKDIYEEIRSLTKLSKPSVLKLRKLELRVEKDVMTYRKLGVDLLRYAKSQNKDVILVSDMYLEKDDIAFLLKKSGIDGYDELFVSSEYGETKKEGGLFIVVKEKYKNKKVLHLGDNHLADVLRPLEHDISSEHLPIICDTYHSSSLAKEVYSPKDVTDSLGNSILHGINSREFYDNRVFTDNWFDQSPYRMGFEACGSILLGFAKWVLEQSLRDGVSNLYFLARDGFLVKEIYDQISVNVPGAPKSHYLLASRRCYSTAALECEQDILDSLSMSFSKVSYKKILEARYGVEVADLKPDTLKFIGVKSYDEEVDIKRRSQLNKFKRLLSFNKDIILEKAATEREALLSYFESMGISSQSNAFHIVDIGHNASLQRYLGKLNGGRNDIGGYYFMTYFGARSVYNEGFDVKGYLSDFEDSKCSDHPYCKNIGMFEFLFLPDIPSFKRFSLRHGRITEEFVGGDESARFAVIRKVHQGIKDYVDTVLKVVNGDVSKYDVSKNKSIHTYINFIQNPHTKDSMMFDALSFVDQFGGSDSRFLIATPKFPDLNYENFSDYIKASWWREGANALVNGREVLDSDILESSKRDKALTEKKMSIFKRKVRKLKNNPKGFIVDSKLVKLFK